MFANLERFLVVNSPDPEQARRGRLLNILLAGVLAVSIFVVLFLVGGVTIARWTIPQAAPIIGFIGMFILFGGALFLINRRWSRMATYLFILLLIVAIAVRDSPTNHSGGSSIFFYAVPLVAASMLIEPWAGFAVAAICSVAITITNSIYFPASSPNFIVMFGYFFLALVAWLPTSDLEALLKKFRQVNASLDQQVQERTRELDEALRRERIEAGKTKAILESIADGVIVFDPAGRALLANPACGRIFGVPYDRIPGTRMAELGRVRALEPKDRLFLAGMLADPEPRLANQRIAWDKQTYSVTAAPVRDPQGEAIGTVMVLRDTTHDAEVERMKNTFLAIVSHELRSPLNAMRTYAELLKEAFYGPVSQKQVQVAEWIMTYSSQLLEMVRNLLDQAQMEVGKLVLHVQPFRPSELVESARRTLDKAAAEKGLTLTGELDPQLPEFLEGDLARLQQILMNLLNNAVKFTQAGSIHFRLALDGRKSWIMEVRDTGIGIPAAEQPYIFDAFRQADSVIDHRYDGLGLGLTIVKQLSELMGGSVAVHSTEGLGSQFVVTLPLLRTKKSKIPV